MKKELLEKINHMTLEEQYNAMYTDPLTGALNRRALESMEFNYIAIIDVDSLKYVNDEFGHRQGDWLLKHVCLKLNQALPDDNIFRISGDEFAITSNSPYWLFRNITDARSGFDGFSFGVGVTFEEADRMLKWEKKNREINGLRAKRGHMPPWIETIVLDNAEQKRVDQ